MTTFERFDGNRDSDLSLEHNPYLIEHSEGVVGLILRGKIGEAVKETSVEDVRKIVNLLDIPRRPDQGPLIESDDDAA